MRSLLIFRVRSLLTVAFLVCATVTSACAQEKPKLMVQGSSEFTVVPETLGEKEDGIAQITFGGISPPPKPTEYTYLGMSGLKDAPPLPTGYVLFKDLVFRVTTQALIAGSHLTVFRVASATTELDFGKLTILHLEYDALSPSNFKWEDATVFPGGWDEHFHHIPKRLYDAAQSDFKSKHLAGITNEFGIFAIALAPQSEPQQSGPFPEVTVNATSSPEPAQGGQDVTHTITFANKGTTAAAEINFKEVFDPPLEFISSDTSQGVCKQKEAGNIVVCHLGPLAGGGQARVRIITRTRPDGIWKDRLELVTTLEVVFKETSTDFVDERGQIFTHFTTTLIKKP